jgi:predicted ATP-grasp superfamily ATP-dependent carboligase
VICPACKDAKFRAYAVYYARHGIQIPHEILWPVWVKDRPASGALIAAKMPVCSVHAEGNSTQEVKAILEKQLETIESIIMTHQDAA